MFFNFEAERRKLREEREAGRAEGRKEGRAEGQRNGAAEAYAEERNKILGMLAALDEAARSNPDLVPLLLTEYKNRYRDSSANGQS